MYAPNIFFLQLTDAPDSSAEGVAWVLEEVLSQIGVDAESFADGVEVLESLGPVDLSKEEDCIKLMERLQMLIQQLKMQAGHNISFQNNSSQVTTESMKNFLRYAQNKLHISRNPPNTLPVTTAYMIGIQAMIRTTWAERVGGQGSRFQWGGPNMVQVDDEIEEGEEGEPKDEVPRQSEQ
ncbi:uncharacterized protein MELLADRAFT_104421 [Melampsora larici-populina 98AG31]|uniref:Uncharacterized protein n=1 Tax=Melampsora larici-populina (strain 98AG31 / pathotype 3-4-7) TaxID=747676 RepID=F4REM2_MELLP|nr:uncharacterized protein MELLADRAFT_104421 [Melampsora larici-populina 98AG31]EGG09253.1 hypothetical protein MELLADRAFT_104421 [Melampsora larici-populina 98AG31]